MQSVAQEKRCGGVNGLSLVKRLSIGYNILGPRIGRGEPPNRKGLEMIALPENLRQREPRTEEDFFRYIQGELENANSVEKDLFKEGLQLFIEGGEADLAALESYLPRPIDEIENLKEGLKSLYVLEKFLG